MKAQTQKSRRRTPDGTSGTRPKFGRAYVDLCKSAAQRLDRLEHLQLAGAVVLTEALDVDASEATDDFKARGVECVGAALVPDVRDDAVDGAVDAVGENGAGLCDALEVVAPVVGDHAVLGEAAVGDVAKLGGEVELVRAELLGAHAAEDRLKVLEPFSSAVPRLVAGERVEILPAVDDVIERLNDGELRVHETRLIGLAPHGVEKCTDGFLRRHDVSPWVVESKGARRVQTPAS